MKKINLKGIEFAFKKHLPEILTVSGVVGTVAGVIFACKATVKAVPIVEEHKEAVVELHNAKESYEDKKEYNKDITKEYVKTTAKLVKCYALPTVLVAGGLTAAVGGNYILKKRNLALTAAYTTLDTAYKKYQERVEEEVGKEKAEDIRNGVKTVKIEEKVTDEKGKTKNVKKEIKVVGEDISEYAKFFDCTSREWYEDPELSLAFLLSAERHFNDLLRANGHVFLNEVYKYLDIPETKAGQIVGWWYDADNQTGDNHISFGIHKYNVRGVNGYEDTFLLDFNVDGNIWENIPFQY